MADCIERGATQIVDVLLDASHPLHVVAQRGWSLGATRLREHQVQQPVAEFVARGEPFLQHGAELRPQRAHGVRLVLLQALDRVQRLLGRERPDRLDLPVVLQHLARDVQRQIFAVDHALQEPQPLRQQRLPVVHDMDAFDVELHPLGDPVAVIQVERGLGGDEQENAGVERPLHAGQDRGDRVLPVVREVPVELVILLVGHLAARAGPDCFHRVQCLVLGDGLRQHALDRRAGVVEHWLLSLDPHPDRVRDEVGVLLDDLLQYRRVGVVLEPVLLVHRLEVQQYRGAGLGPVRVVDRVGAVAGRFPADRGVGAGAPGGQRDPVGRHEGGVEADAELPDQVGSRRGAAITAGGLFRLQGGEEFPAAGAGDGADVTHHFLAAHPDAVVRDRECPGVRVDLEADLQLAVRQQVRGGQPLQA